MYSFYRGTNPAFPGQARVELRCRRVHIVTQPTPDNLIVNVFYASYLRGKGARVALGGTRELALRRVHPSSTK